MDRIINSLVKLKILKKDLDYHLIRASMIVIFLFFGYQKWFNYEAQALIPYIDNGPSFPVCIRFSASAGLLTFWALRNGCLAASCSWASGIKDWELSEPSVHALPLWRRSRLSRLCRMAGLPLPAGFLP